MCRSTWSSTSLLMSNEPHKQSPSGRSKMRAIHMRKLILIPTIVITGFLALAFVQPAGAAGLVRAVAPGLHVDFPAAVSAAGGTLLRVAARASGSGASSQSRAGLAQGSDAVANPATVHSVSTASRQNC